MIVIGILAPEHDVSIIKLLKKRFYANKKTCMVIKAENVETDYIYQLGSMGIDFMIIDIYGYVPNNVFLDLLIYDNTADKILCDINIKKNITANTKLIYNGDVGKVHISGDFDMISYGLSHKADITLSSICTCGDGAEIIYCIQRNITALSGKMTEISERVIKYDEENINVYHILACAAAEIICMG